MKKLFALFVVLLAGQTTTFAQAIYTPEELLQHFAETAKSYEIQAGGERLAFRSQPLMHWKNPERQQDQGAMYAWERNGRPLVLGSIFTYEYGGNVFCRHEMLSLADTPLTAKLDGSTVWSPNRVGLQWKPFDDTTTPADSAARRLFQMRTLARKFTGSLKVPNQQPSILVLLPQPLVRYESAKEDVIDGAVFSLAVGTDPEILLVIEARKSSDGTPKFFYSPARSHYHSLELQLDGAKVWDAPMVIALETTRAGQSPYCNEPFFVMTPNKPLPSPEQLR